MTQTQTKTAADSMRKQIKVALTRKDISISQLSDKTGVCYSTMCSWINNPHRLNMEQWAAINSVLQLDPALFNAGAGFVRGGQAL